MAVGRKLSHKNRVFAACLIISPKTQEVCLGVARGLLQERPLQFQHGNVRVKSWQPMSNSWSTSSQPDFVRALGNRKTVRNRQARILCIELLKSWSTLARFLANSPSHGKMQGSSLQESSGNIRFLVGKRFANRNLFLKHLVRFARIVSSLRFVFKFA